MFGYLSLCRHNGIQEDKLFTVSTTSVDAFCSSLRGSEIPLKFSAKYANNLPLSLNFDINYNFASKFSLENQLIDLVKGLLDLGNGKNFTPGVEDRVVVKFFCNGEENSGVIKFGNRPLSSRFWSALFEVKCKSFYVNLAQCYSRKYYHSTIAGKGKFLNFDQRTDLSPILTKSQGWMGLIHTDPIFKPFSSHFYGLNWVFT